MVGCRYKPMDFRTVSLFCRELEILLHTGMSLASVLEIMAENMDDNKKTRSICRKLLEKVQYGFLFSEAMEMMNPVFPEVLIRTFQAAEEHGNLTEAAHRMAVYFQKEYQVQEKLRHISWYPRFLMLLLLGAVFVIVEMIFPEMEDLFSGLEELPMPTRILYALADIRKVYGTRILLGAGIGIFLTKLAGRYPIVKKFTGWIRLVFPVSGRMVRILYSARFAQTFSMLYTAGLPMLSVLSAAKKTIGNRYLELQFEQVMEAAENGESLSDALAYAKGLEPILVKIVRIGEAADSLDMILNRTAEDLSFEAEMASEKMMSYLEPFFIFIMAGIIGFVMLAVMLPVYESYALLELAAY